MAGTHGTRWPRKSTFRSYRRLTTLDVHRQTCIAASGDLSAPPGQAQSCYDLVSHLQQAHPPPEVVILYPDASNPVPRQSLADDLAKRIRGLIRRRKLGAGDRLPSIADMARHFGVGAPTLREALKKLETVGAVDIRHGSGVYVAQHYDTLIIPNPIFEGRASKKQLVDLIEARIPIEVQSASLAAANATPEHLAELTHLLERASANFDHDALLTQTNLAFHRQIAVASGNTVLFELLRVLSSLFRDEQRQILDIHGSRRQDHREHMGILDALRRRAPALAAKRMRAHLEGVRAVLSSWDPATSPRQERADERAAATDAIVRQA
jgi:GntR family transcriptional regulator, transcriptional repressor for pyruvate dehydrogenase complex